MRVALISGLLFALVTVPIFGFAFMSHDGGDMHGSCLATVVGDNVGCPGMSDAFAYAILHIRAFKLLQLATLTGGLLAAFLALVLALVSFSQKQGHLDVGIFSRSTETYEWRHFELPAIFFRKLFLSWFSLRESSPSLI